MSREKQIEEMDLAVLNCYRNKYYADGNSTEQGIIANAINNVLPTLVSLRNGDYRKQSEGEWQTAPDGTHWCSECGHDATYTFDGTEICGVACPFCGAKMKERI